MHALDISLGEHGPSRGKFHHLLANCYNRNKKIAWPPTDLAKVNVKMTDQCGRLLCFEDRLKLLGIVERVVLYCSTR